MWQYTQDALALFRTRWGDAEEMILRDGTPGLKIRGKPGGIFTADGRIVTFWYD